MAARKTTPKDTGTSSVPEDVENNEESQTPDNAENDTQDNGTKTFDEKVAEEIAKLPTVDDPLASMLMERIATGMVRARDYNETIRRNSVDNDAVVYFAEHNEENEEVNKKRADFYARKKEIAELRSRADKLSGENGALWDEILSDSREILQESVNLQVKARAFSNLEEVREQVTSFLNSFRTAVPNPDSEEMLGFQRAVNITLWGSPNGHKSSTPGPVRSRSDRSRSEAIRAWALNNGMNVNERGRIPQYIIDAYEDAERKGEV